MSFSFRLRDKRSRYLKSTLFSKAYFYEIWHGQKCVVKSSLFPKNKKTAAEKKAYLQRKLAILVGALLRAQEAKAKERRKKQQALEKKKKAQRQKKLKEKRAAEKKEKERLARQKESLKKREKKRKLKAASLITRQDQLQDRKSRKEAARILALKEDIKRKEKEVYRLLQKEKVKKGETRRELSRVRPTKVKKPAVIEPVETFTPKYSKEYIEKTIVSDRVSMYDEEQILEIDIRTLDFTLSEPVVIISGKMTKEKMTIARKFLPHIQKFFNESKGTEQMFIFRIKYDTFVDKTKKLVQHSGVGSTRVFATQFSTLWESVMIAFGRMESRLGNYLGRSATKELLITGFTLENVLRKKSLKQ